jgi:hypothetical protein
MVFVFDQFFLVFCQRPVARGNPKASHPSKALRVWSLSWQLLSELARRRAPLPNGIRMYY